MMRFWKRKKVDVRSAAMLPVNTVSPSTTTTRQGRSGAYSASDATRTSWVLHTTAPNCFNERSTTSNNPRRGQSCDFLIWDDAPERKRMTTRPYDSVTVEAIAADDAAAAVVRYQGLEAYGSSKRNKHERKNADTGLDIAIGRAFKNLGHKMERRGLNRIGD